MKPHVILGLLWTLLWANGAAALTAFESRLVSVHPIDWQFADGRVTEAFLVLEDGREVRFAHEQVTRLQPGERLRLHPSVQGRPDRRIPVICTLERLDTDGQVWRSSRSNLCPPSEREM